VIRRTPARDTYDRLATFPIDERQERGSLAELISAIVVRFFGDRRQAMLEESSPAMLATTWRSCRFLRNSLSRLYSSVWPALEIYKRFERCDHKRDDAGRDEDEIARKPRPFERVHQRAVSERGLRACQYPLCSTS
jgi:hypothetical protein